jgi:hypothetical protein
MSERNEALDPLLIQLRRLTPMPPDERISTVLFRAYQDVVQRVLALEPRDARAIAPLFASFGPGKCRGLYERICMWVRAFPDEVAGPALMGQAARGTAEARRWAVRTLGEMACLAAEETVRAALEDDDLEVRKAADLALRMIEASKPEPEDDDGASDPLFEGIANTD